MATFQPGQDPELLKARRGDVVTQRRVTDHRALIMMRLVRAGWIRRVDGEDGGGCWDHVKRNLRLIHSIAREEDGCDWIHVSMSRRDRKMPTWEQVRDIWWECYPNRKGIVVIAPKAEHVNIAEVAHVWCCFDEVLPDFTSGTGSI